MLRDDIEQRIFTRLVQRVAGIRLDVVVPCSRIVPNRGAKTSSKKRPASRRAYACARPCRASRVRASRRITATRIWFGGHRRTVDAHARRRIPGRPRSRVDRAPRRRRVGRARSRSATSAAMRPPSITIAASSSRPSASNVTPFCVASPVHGTIVLARTSVSKLLADPSLKAPVDVCAVGSLDREVVARVGVAHDAHTAIRGQHALQPLLRILRAVGDHNHARVQTVADTNAAAMMKAHPVRARCGVEQGVRIGQSAIASLPSFIDSVSRYGEATLPVSRSSRPMTIGALTSPNARVR